MCASFTKFPTTPHLLWMGRAAARGDKVLSPAEAISFLAHPVIVEEKVDGANLGISFDAQGNLRAQNRGNFLEPGAPGQFAPIWPWLARRETPLFDALEDRYTLFGEWCYARHSIHYTRLPDFFLAFDILDRREQKFLSSGRRDAILLDLELIAVPKVGEGVFRLSELPDLIGPSGLYDGPMEGIYLRQESPTWLSGRAKIVRPEFVQQIGEHWSKQPLVPNTLRPADR